MNKLRSKGFVTSEYSPDSTRFMQHLIEYNNLDELGFEEWVFHPGMLFDSTDRWWGDWGNRDKPHEGLDLCLYRDRCGENHSLDEKIKVPVIYGGKVVRVIDDYIGKSVFVGHDICDSKGNQLYTVYGHIEPQNEVSRGKTLIEGDIIATITDTRGKKVEISPHLHISIAWIPECLPYEKLNWKSMGDSEIVTLLNPLKVFDCKYTVLRGV